MMMMPMPMQQTFPGMPAPMGTLCNPRCVHTTPSRKRYSLQPGRHTLMKECALSGMPMQPFVMQPGYA